MNNKYPFTQDLSFIPYQNNDELAVEYQEMTASKEDVLNHVRELKELKKMPLFNLPYIDDDIAELENISKNIIDNYKQLVVIGTGGSSLGARALINIKQQDNIGYFETIPVRFLENPDPTTINRFLSKVNFDETAFLIISKSGTTVETLSIAFAVMAQAIEELEQSQISKNFYVITEPKDSPLARFAKSYNLNLLEHDPNLGGRFSTFGNVGLLPALVAGLDVRAFRKGAREVLDYYFDALESLQGDISEDSYDLPAYEAAILQVLYANNGYKTTPLFSYDDRLADFGMWYRQVWAESLGKDGCGTTPIRALGTIDQHSQLQLYLGGSDDKIFTVLENDNHFGSGKKIDDSFVKQDDRLDYLSGAYIGDVIGAEQQATRNSLIQNNKPTRTWKIKNVDEGTMGALMMHVVVETVCAAYLWQINPFDQPAVEQGKILTREYLAQIGQFEAQADQSHILV